MRAIVLIDGQNLYHLARRAWASGPQSPYAWPNYDVENLAGALVAGTPGRSLAETRFYTGVPDPASGPSQLFWHGFWSNKIRYLRSRGVYVYRGRVNAGGQEKGVDVSLALDLVRATYDRQFEVAIIVSQDWDFGPDLVRPVHDRRGSKRFDSIHWHPDAVPWRCLFHPSCTGVGLGNVSGRRHEGMGTGRVRALEFLPSLTPRGGLMLNDDRLDDRLIEDDYMVDMEELIRQLNLEGLVERYATRNFVPVPDRILTLSLDD